MKHILLILLLIGCKEHICPIKYVFHDTLIKQRIDTLVIIQEYDSVSWSTIDTTSGFYILPGGSEMGPATLFKDGKRSDTIRKTRIIYY